MAERGEGTDVDHVSLLRSIGAPAKTSRTNIEAPPLDGEGLGWGVVRHRALRVSNRTPTLPSPIEGEGSKRGSGRELKLGFGQFFDPADRIGDRRGGGFGAEG